jgi:hypothetical protein
MGPRELDSKRRFEQESAMRRTETSMMFRALRLAVVPLVVGLTASAARAADDDRSFTEKVMEGFYGAVRGTNMDNRGIDYRERSPLVVPPTLDLPPPAAASAEAPIANWPKDPDERQRKAIIAAKKKNAPPPARVQVSAGGTGVAAQPINIAPPVEPQQAAASGTSRPSYAADRNGTARVDPVYDQSGDLLTNGTSVVANWGDSVGLGGLFGSSGKSNTAVQQPGTEPMRESLTQPPMGYQTPSPKYVYGPEEKSIWSGTSRPDKLNPASPATSEAH